MSTLKWTEKELEEFAILVKREREALNEFEHLLRLVRDQAEPLENVQPRVQELLKMIGESNSKLQKFLQSGTV